MSVANQEDFMPAAGTVRAAFDAYLAQDIVTAERLLADDFVFTSPQDDHISKTEFLERCFPTASRLRSQEILELVSAGSDGVFILYEYQLTTGERHRNTEFVTVRDGQLARRYRPVTCPLGRTLPSDHSSGEIPAQDDACPDSTAADPVPADLRHTLDVIQMPVHLRTSLSQLGSQTHQPDLRSGRDRSNGQCEDEVGRR